MYLTRELKAGLEAADTCGRLAAAGGGGAATGFVSTGFVSAGFVSGHDSADVAAGRLYNDPAEAMGLPTVGLVAAGRDGFDAGGGAFLIAAMSGRPIGV